MHPSTKLAAELVDAAFAAYWRLDIRRVPRDTVPWKMRDEHFDIALDASHLHIRPRNNDPHA